MIMATMVCLSLAYPGYEHHGYHGYGGHHQQAIAHHGGGGGGGYDHGGYADEVGESDYGHHQQIARIGESHGHEYADQQHHHEEHEEHVDYYVS